MSSRALALLEERQQRLSPAAPYEPFAHLDEPEAQVVKALSNGSPAIRLQALALLVRVRSPSSVAEQWKAVAELKRQLVSRAWDRALFEIEACFDPAEVSAEISRQPATSSRSSRDYACEWRLRAAGVMKLWAMLPRLRELSVSTDLNISIAAVRSLEDFTGPEADEALTYCLLGWRYYSFIRAGRALLERNPELLLKVLSSVEAPENCREWQKFFEMHGRIRLETKRSQLSG